ncbi:MAG: hypothetical protein HZY75_13125 [Nocardioidaceae bacterium]|nr:MAG: hypothetical protein HZY75_13125 [Nocardioidaceae bacterium]
MSARRERESVLLLCRSLSDLSKTASQLADLLQEGREGRTKDRAQCALGLNSPDALDAFANDMWEAIRKGVGLSGEVGGKVVQSGHGSSNASVVDAATEGSPVAGSRQPATGIGTADLMLASARAEIARMAAARQAREHEQATGSQWPGAS